MNKSLIFRPGDRPTAKRPKKGPAGFLCYIYNIKIRKPRLHARAPHARITRKIIYTTTYCCIYIFCPPLFVKFFVQFVSMCSELCPFFLMIYIYIYHNPIGLTTFWLQSKSLISLHKMRFLGGLLPWFCKTLLLLYLFHIFQFITLLWQ